MKIWDFKVKKGDIETTNIKHIDFVNSRITWHYKTDEVHEDKIENVELFAFVEGLGYKRVGYSKDAQDK